MFKLYKKSQQAQYNWIRRNPGKYIALNAIIAIPFIGYIMYKDRKNPLYADMQSPPFD